MRRSKNILVMGRGCMGQAIAHYMKAYGCYNVYTIDKDDTEGRDTTRDYVFNIRSSDLGYVLDDLHPDMVISAMPYFLNTHIAEKCIDRRIPYLDLGGHVDTTKRINAYAEQKKCCVFTDLGLAPGLVNWLGLMTVRSMGHPAETVEMYCGGICKVAQAHNRYNIIPTWSIEGLYNEYVDDCEILSDGEVTTVPGLSGHQSLFLIVDGIPPLKLEAFYTSGGIGTSLDLFERMMVKNVSYKTMRHAGHLYALRKAINGGGKDRMSKEIMAEYETMPNKTDVVYIHVQSKTKLNKHGFDCSVNKTIVIDAKDNMSAMQRATCAPCAAVAHQILKPTSVYSDRPLNYLDIECDNFYNSLNYLGVQL